MKEAGVEKNTKIVLTSHEEGSTRKYKNDFDLIKQINDFYTNQNLF